jgi:hypothetical protein
MTKAVKTKADGTYCGQYSQKTYGKIERPKNLSSAFSGSPAADTKQAAADEKFFTDDRKKTKQVRFPYGRT